MEDLGFIRDLFHPLQPTVNSSGGTVVYNELIPDPQLCSLIYCYWQLESTEELKGDYSYRVVSDGCIDILWEVNSPEEIFINGFTNKYTLFELSSSFSYLGIRFLPTAIPLLFGIPAKELTNEFLNLKDVLPNFFNSLKAVNTVYRNLKDISLSLNSLIQKELSLLKIDTDPRFFNSLLAILKSQGTINLSRELDTGISQRQLRRMFDFYIGDSPKTFAKVVRFQNILMSKPSVQSLKSNKLFYDVGFFDQAHFIKDFKYMYGLTPTIALL